MEMFVEFLYIHVFLFLGMQGRFSSSLGPGQLGSEKQSCERNFSRVIKPTKVNE